MSDADYCDSVEAKRNESTSPGRAYGEQLGEALEAALHPPTAAERAVLYLTGRGYTVDETTSLHLGYVEVAKPGHEPIRVTHAAFEDLPTATIAEHADRQPPLQRGDLT